jgi:hypothetical protein
MTIDDRNLALSFVRKLTVKNMLESYENLM